MALFVNLLVTGGSTVWWWWPKTLVGKGQERSLPSPGLCPHGSTAAT